MIYNTKGNIFYMSEIESGTSKNGYEWSRMYIVIDIPGPQGSTTKQMLQVSRDRIDDVQNFAAGDLVEIGFVVYAREWNDKWFNNVELVSIKDAGSQPAPKAKTAKKVEAPVADLPEDEDTGLPF